MIRPDRGDLTAILLFGLLTGALSLATPVAVQQLVNSVALGGLMQPVIVLALMLLVCLTFSAVLIGLQSYVAEIVQRRIFMRLVADLARRFPQVRIDTFDRRHAPEVVNRFFDVLTIQKTGTSLLLDGVALVLQTTIGLLVLSFYHPVMLGFSAVLVAGIASVVVLLGRGAVRTAVAESQSKYAVEAWLEEMADHVREFKQTGAARFAMHRADELARDYLRARTAHYRIVLRQLCGALGLQVIASSGLLAIGGALVIDGQLTLGQLVASELIVTAIVASFAKLGKHLEGWYDLMAAVDKVGVLLDLPLERDDGTDQELAAGPMEVEIHGIDFGFGGKPVLRNLSLQVDAGERIALTGPSGSGKSTVLLLMLGLRSPQSGYVTVDGVDLRELRLKDFREQVAHVNGAEIIEGTVEENVRMGRAYITRPQVRAALEAVGMLAEVLAFPEGVQTRLGAGGLTLSGGQGLRITIARAIAGAPRLVLLDEPSIGLDAETSQQMLAALFDENAGWTLVVASASGVPTGDYDRIIPLRGPTGPHDSDGSARRGVGSEMTGGCAASGESR